MAALNLIAHRLGRAYGPDSSRAALEASLGGRLYGLETDLCLTADGELVEHFLLSRPLIDTLRLAGLSVNTGTVNRAELLERTLAFEPDAVCTDRPHELRAAWGALGGVAETPIEAAA